MKKAQAGWLWGAIVSLLVLAGCGNENAAPSEPEKQAQELVMAVSKDIKDMNPHLYTGSMFAQGMLYESLVENTEEGIKPLLAESWEISGDGKVYTFHLRKNVAFHDGAPFNADAVKKNIEAIQHNAAKHSWIKLSTKIASCNVVDEHTVELVLTEPYYPTLVELAMTRPYVFVSPKNFIEGETKDGLNGYSGTGPYKLVEHQAEQSAVFEANEQYWGGAPAIKKITAKVLPAGETTYLALQKGEVNFAFTDDRGANNLDVEAMNQLEQSGKYQIVRSQPMNTNFLAANSSKKESPVHDRAVREALWYAMDRELISKQIFAGKEPPADTLFSSNVNYANVELKQREYAPEKAKQLLDEAGWVAEQAGGVRKKNGAVLAMKLYYDVNSSAQKTEAEWMQDQLKGIGIQLDLIGEESSSIASRRSSGDYDLLFNQTWGLAYDPQSTIAAFTSKSSYYYTTSGIAQADELYKKINDVMVSTEEQARKSLYRDILNIVHEEAVFIPLTNGSVTIVAPKALQGISFKQTQYELPFERMSFATK
ncbi:staphylopine-dependent metal ABC transporter substrate-binding lipoprotein [Brevibacillus parabrevis]|uniref:staphylopine-dependent metal ABC transporter substrate-binding lipoprotein n=1 Tax=Brevibacillus parabrevis TaxID=54914 RepID=UPI0028D89F24|nr:nickel ABC transporter substrate-binding protein [Brevibacillus parabrevis]